MEAKILRPNFGLNTSSSSGEKEGKIIKFKRKVPKSKNIKPLPINHIISPALEAKVENIEIDLINAINAINNNWHALVRISDRLEEQEYITDLLESRMLKLGKALKVKLNESE